MKREDLEKYLGKFVDIKLFNGEIIKGCLRKTKDEMFKCDANLYLPKNYYFVTGSYDTKINRRTSRSVTARKMNILAITVMVWCQYPKRSVMGLSIRLVLSVMGAKMVTRFMQSNLIKILRRKRNVWRIF